jgi:hypothetical protein
MVQIMAKELHVRVSDQSYNYAKLVAAESCISLGAAVTALLGFAREQGVTRLAVLPSVTESTEGEDQDACQDVQL